MEWNINMESDIFDVMLGKLQYEEKKLLGYETE
jgi:hypothetical protein